MTEVISVRFKNKGKTYYFDPNGCTAEIGDHLIVETSKGLEYAECVKGNHEVGDENVVQPLRPCIRKATPEDDKRDAENRRREVEAFDICRDRIEQHGLDMKLVDVEYNYEGNKILFFFTSDGRVDFRDLVKDLASVFKTRIELRQIGVRDEARMLGGLGICGKPFCCAQFLDDFEPVSIKMAKTQGLSLNPTKISGTCGRLMCCLKYEQEAYEELVKDVPKVDSFVQTPDGKGIVVDVNLLRGRCRVKIDEANELTMKTYAASEVSVLGGKAARAEYLAGRNEELERAQAKKAAEKAAEEARRAEREAAEKEKESAPAGPKKEHQNHRHHRGVRNDRAAKEAIQQSSAEQTPKTETEKKPHTQRNRRNHRPRHRQGGSSGEKSE